MPATRNRAVVSLVVVDQVDDVAAHVAAPAAAVVHHAHRGGGRPLRPRTRLQTTIDCGVAAVIRRAEADQDRLVATVMALAQRRGGAAR